MQDTPSIRFGIAPPEVVKPENRLWPRLGRLLAGSLARGQAILSSLVSLPREDAFALSLIALAAKLAKADGRITLDEVRTFRSFIEIPQGEEKNAARIFNLCGQTTDGYEHYAKKLDKALGSEPMADQARRNVLDMLFHVAMADGEFHPREAAFLDEVARIFRIPSAEVAEFRARHVPGSWSASLVLGVSSDADEQEIRQARKRLAKENHPDVMIASGMPAETIAVAHARMSDINRAAEEMLEALKARTAPGL
ncbi:TerB family tellurite resistance protein [Cereibacter sphaeroides]|uniref:TerB family tellurite resistance protein n=1 Tax=Cereibacter sphaeroides TaxID=1063 RepID=UPI001F47640E|nr:TerB family tellurite resistance protein [Cereibacter sphaeroides]MCE6957745.1 TerB family tellurite resistance protein [Cereibacter sphaeroides]MCE6971629.1 TerB family tellurite resistance protein [Cereibacter sphaeroides]